ncbi:MAG: cell division protein FtsL [Pseudomonadota bacterium]
MKGLLLLGVLVLAVILTGVQVAQTGYAVRGLNGELERLRQDYDAALNEQTQLQLERSAVASYALTEATAQRQLSMIYPATMIDVRSDQPAEPQP